MTTRLIAQDYSNFPHLNAFPQSGNNGHPELLDVKILNILIHHALDHPKGFRGLSIRRILRGLNGYAPRGGVKQFTRKETGEVRRALLVLEKQGLTERIRCWRQRWKPTTHAIVVYGMAEGSQTKMEKWV